jgi:hypothetical protein
MMTVFWSVNGFHVVDQLPKKTTMDAVYFQTRILDPLKELLKPEESTVPIWLHYDNCGPHKAIFTSDYVCELGFSRIPHPPYSPDLAPCDFTIFANVKSKLKGHVAKTHDEIACLFRQKLPEIFREERIATMYDWMKRLDYVIQSGGEIYF